MWSVHNYATHGCVQQNQCCAMPVTLWQLRRTYRQLQCWPTRVSAPKGFNSRTYVNQQHSDITSPKCTPLWSSGLRIYKTVIGGWHCRCKSRLHRGSLSISMIASTLTLLCDTNDCIIAVQTFAATEQPGVPQCCQVATQLAPSLQRCSHLAGTKQAALTHC